MALTYTFMVVPLPSTVSLTPFLYHLPYTRSRTTVLGFCQDIQEEITEFHNVDEYEERFPVISSYQPALPPLQALQTSRSRDARTNIRYCGSPGKNEGREEKVDYHLPTKTFRKWYRMTYPDKPPLTPLKASQLKRSYNSDEKREIDRISRLVTNRRAFCENRKEKVFSVGRVTHGEHSKASISIRRNDDDSLYSQSRKRERERAHNKIRLRSRTDWESSIRE
ncbi:hypothetical protein LENED_004492 [Lentinula edodes]|uniref:Uncharacterized protein n=1 Tax=Lentinula edodes TaxID=5353 RepID=A0A1Q3E6H1_LENED|nr:hypothetical protein LENED_004492 [Lentinula edodes]